MHLLIPFAGASFEPARQALATLALPHLARLLGRMAAQERDTGTEDSLTPPHERALGRSLGWQHEDGRWPLAGLWAHQDGVAGGWAAVDALPVGLMTPVHWAVGSDQVTLLDPQLLQLHEGESRQLLAALADALFAPEGWSLHYGAPTRWYARHPSLAGLRTASLDRVIGRNVDPWMPEGDAARALRRLQSEAQMLLHRHPVNEAREARGELPVNSFWLSGCGPTTMAAARPAHAVEAVEVLPQLRAPALAGDWEAWSAAWRELDAQTLAPLPPPGDDPFMITLCGERHAQRHERAARPWWQSLRARWGAPSVQAVLEAL